MRFAHVRRHRQRQASRLARRRRWPRRRHGARPARARPRAAAPRRRIRPGAVSMATSRAPPTVSVPVLSNMTVCVRASASSGPPPLIRMPWRAARETPAMKATGAARISGQGVAATSTASPRSGSPDEQPRRAGDDQRHRQQQQRVAVGEPNERRLRRLRRGHHPDDAGIGAFAGGRRGAQLEGLAGIDRAAAAPGRRCCA